MIKFVAHKIMVKANTSPKSGSFLGQHAFNGQTYQGKSEDFQKQPELFDSVTGPFHNDEHANAYFHHTGPHASPTFKTPAEMGFKPHRDSGHFEAPGNLMSSYADAKNTAVPGKFDYPKPRPTSELTPDHGPTFRNISKAIRQNGGTHYMVGGYPRDFLRGKDSKDKDVEVYGMDADKLQKSLEKFGHVDSVGSSFGVIKLKTPDGQDYDFSLPRRENKEGQGHKGFQVSVDPTMTPKEASSRRDFTINALMQHPDDGRILDFHGGLQDLKNKKLRHVSDKFAEDPLRVLRGMQMASRFDMDMDPSTAALSKSLFDEYPTLSKDRVMGEFQKLAEKGVKPSKAFKVLQDTGWDKHFPELAGRMTPSKMQEMDNMSKKLQSGNFSPEDKNALFFSSLTHDMSPEAASSFLSRIGLPQPIQKRVLALQKGMNSPHANAEEVTPANVRNTSHHVSPEKIDNLMHVMDAKHGERTPKNHSFSEMAHNLGVHESKPKPLIDGNVLKDMGIKPGPNMGKLLNEVYNAQLNGDISTPEEAVQWLKNNQ
jgi:tRNA nucleotidyltransferase (CCA-adding enzyme)